MSASGPFDYWTGTAWAPFTGTGPPGPQGPPGPAGEDGADSTCQVRPVRPVRLPRCQVRPVRRANRDRRARRANQASRRLPVPVPGDPCRGQCPDWRSGTYRHLCERRNDRRLDWCRLDRFAADRAGGRFLRDHVAVLGRGVRRNHGERVGDRGRRAGAFLPFVQGPPLARRNPDTVDRGGRPDRVQDSQQHRRGRGRGDNARRSRQSGTMTRERSGTSRPPTPTTRTITWWTGHRFASGRNVSRPSTSIEDDRTRLVAAQTLIVIDRRDGDLMGVVLAVESAGRVRGRRPERGRLAGMGNQVTFERRIRRRAGRVLPPHGQ